MDGDSSELAVATRAGSPPAAVLDHPQNSPAVGLSVQETNGPPLRGQNRLQSHERPRDKEHGSSERGFVQLRQNRMVDALLSTHLTNHEWPAQSFEMIPNPQAPPTDPSIEPSPIPSSIGVAKLGSPTRQPSTTSYTVLLLQHYSRWLSPWVIYSTKPSEARPS